MELSNRGALEPEFASRIASLNGRQRRELEEYLTRTDPPDIHNVPQEAWDRWEREHRDTLLALLILVFLYSVSEHGGDMDNEAQAAGLQWALSRANAVAKEWRHTGEDMLKTAGADWQAKRAAWEAKVARARELTNERFGIPGVTDFETGPIARSVIDELQIPMTPIDRQEVFDRAANIFGPSRAEAEAITEFTNAQSAGGEFGINVSVGESPDDTWQTEKDARVCKICKPLQGKNRAKWTRLFPQGPPGHPRCRCWIEYANLPNKGSRLAPVGESAALEILAR